MSAAAELTTNGVLIVAVVAMSEAVKALVAKRKNGNGKNGKLEWIESTCNERHTAIEHGFAAAKERGDSTRAKVERLEQQHTDVLTRLSAVTTELRLTREAIQKQPD